MINKNENNVENSRAKRTEQADVNANARIMSSEMLKLVKFETKNIGTTRKNNT
jgi:hypothetical protein